MYSPWTLLRIELGNLAVADRLLLLIPNVNIKLLDFNGQVASDPGNERCQQTSNGQDTSRFC